MFLHKLKCQISIFFYEDVDYRLKKKTIIAQWITRVITSESNFSISSLNYIFCSDDYLHQLNKEYLDHDTLTDIITFDNSEDALGIEGDIFISTERVLENAGEYDVSSTAEFLRVMAHGVLHLCGYDDKSEKDAEVMRGKEDAALHLSSEYIS